VSETTNAFRHEGWELRPRSYIPYKLFNSLFLGLSVGTIFVIYKPLDPSIYSLGGIGLALAMLAIAQLYGRIMTLPWFFRISLLVELVVLTMVLIFLAKPYTWTTALLVYIGYQVTFSFGSYLVRAETLALEDDELLRRVDSAKQIGYLIGMAASWLTYKVLEHYGITAPEAKVYRLHWLLLATELVIIYFLIGSFKRVTRDK
jgi:putative membrane protein